MLTGKSWPSSMDSKDPQDFANGSRIAVEIRMGRLHHDLGIDAGKASARDRNDTVALPIVR